MPELPEVEVTRQRLLPYLEHRRVRTLHTTPPSYFFLTPPSELKRHLEGRRFETLRRQGKYLLADLDDGSSLLLHLGMTGQLFTEHAHSPRLLRSTGKATLPPEIQARFVADPHTHLRFEFDDGGDQVLFRDARKFGKVLWMAKGRTDPRLEKLGPDALSATGEHLWRAARGRKIPIKTLLLDQAVLAGIGNIYADEALFLSGIRPRRAATRVTRDECSKLAARLREVLVRSIETGGSSISDYIQPDGSDGGYQDERRVYGREHEPCCVCDTPVRRVVIAQRSAHYCPTCQR